MNLMKPPFQHLADELQRRCPEDFDNPQVRAESGQASVEREMQFQLEHGHFEWIERFCTEWLVRVGRKDLVG